MGRYHKHHPLRLAVGLLLLGLVSSALTGMVLGSASKWMRPFRTSLGESRREVRSQDVNGYPRRWNLVEHPFVRVAFWNDFDAYFSNPPHYEMSTPQLIARHGDLPLKPWWLALPKDGHDPEGVWIWAFGWPWPSMAWQAEIFHYDDPRSVRMGFIGADTSIPLRPNWLGLFANAPIHAAIWGVLLIAPGRVRALVRNRRAQCVACGYDVHELATCPECGESTPKQA